MLSIIILQYASSNMWAYLRTNASNRSSGSRNTDVSLGSSVTSLSLGTRMTISTLKVRGRERTWVNVSSFELAPDSSESATFSHTDSIAKGRPWGKT